MEPEFLKKRKFRVYEIIPEYYLPLVEFMMERVKRRKVGEFCNFKSVKPCHIDFLSNVMMDEKLKNLTLGKKKRLMM